MANEYKLTSSNKDKQGGTWDNYSNGSLKVTVHTSKSGKSSTLIKGKKVNKKDTKWYLLKNIMDQDGDKQINGGNQSVRQEHIKMEDWNIIKNQKKVIRNYG